MQFALILLGIILGVAAYRDTLGDLGSIVTGVWADSKGFAYWTLAAIILGFLATIDGLRKPVNLFIVLLILGLVIRKSGTIDQISSQIKGVV